MVTTPTQRRQPVRERKTNRQSLRVVACGACALTSLAACGGAAAGPEPSHAGVSGAPQSPASAAPAQTTGASAPPPQTATGGTGGTLATLPAPGAGGAAANGGAGGALAAVGGGGGGGNAGSAGQGAASANPPLERGGKYVIERGALGFELDPAHGARVTSLRWHGQNLLTGPDIDALNYGSTFWPSPQARWSWPPVPELDSDPYTVELQGDVLSLTSHVGARAKVSVKKRVRALAAADGVELEYALKNEDSAPASWAPWEITRVAAGGLSFFPSGERVVSAQLPVTSQGGITWYQHDASKLGGGGQKLTADGAEGFLAHVAGHSLLVKQFMDVPAAQQAPAPEAEIAIYAATGYVELEPQGAYVALMPGESTTWRVRWLLADIPQDVPIAVGSSALVQLARSLVTQAGK